jgi:hypothetical protein
VWRHLQSIQTAAFFWLQGGQNLTGWPYTAIKRTSINCRRPTAPLPPARLAKRPYRRRCPAPGLKTAEELNPYTPLVCYSILIVACRTHPTDFVSRPNKGVYMCNCIVRTKTANPKNLTGSNSTYNVTRRQLLLAGLVTTVGANFPKKRHILEPHCCLD